MVSESNSLSTPYDFQLKMSPSCQTFSNPLKMSKKHLLHQQYDCYQKLLVFHAMLIVTGQYMNLVEENLIEKGLKVITQKMFKQGIEDYPFKYLSKNRK